MRDQPRIQFRIRRVRADWRIETWFDEPPYGPGWQRMCTGNASAKEAADFMVAHFRTVEWNADRLGGRYIV